MSGQSVQNRPTQETIIVFAPGNDRSMRADLDKQLRFPTDIATTTLRPDIVLWSATKKRVSRAYSSMRGGHPGSTWKEKVVVCWSSGRMLESNKLLSGCWLPRFCERLYTVFPERHCLQGNKSQEAENEGFWLWLRRRDNSWGNREATLWNHLGI